MEDCGEYTNHRIIVNSNDDPWFNIGFSKRLDYRRRLLPCLDLMKRNSRPSGIDSKLVDPAGTTCIVFKIQHLTRSLTGPAQLFVPSSAGQEELVMSYRAPTMGVVPDRESDPSPSHATSPRSGRDTIRHLRNESRLKYLDARSRYSIHADTFAPRGMEEL